MILPEAFDALVITRLLLAVLLGGIIGYDRERSHKTAGLRTHALVAMGSTLLTLLAVYGLSGGSGSMEAAGHLISSIIVGIGFIGGGAIMRQGPQVTGTTTAATLWLVSAVGIGIGMNFITAAVAATIIAYLILTLLKLFEQKIVDHDISEPPTA